MARVIIMMHLQSVRSPSIDDLPEEHFERRKGRLFDLEYSVN